MEAITLVCDGLTHPCGKPAITTARLVRTISGSQNTQLLDLCAEHDALLGKRSRKAKSGRRRKVTNGNGQAEVGTDEMVEDPIISVDA